MHLPPQIQDIVDAALRQNLVVDIDQLINQTCELAAGRTALQYAAVRGHVNVSLRLIEAHANPNVAVQAPWLQLLGFDW